ncbi:DNA-formamidopyrimidine glycosylase family protein [Desulfoplanes sp.]
MMDRGPWGEDMSELPGVETIARGLESLVLGQRVVKAEIRYPGIILGRRSGWTHCLPNRSILGLRRRGKP